MARTPICRRRLLAGAVVAIAAFAVAACGSKSPGSPNSNPTTPQGDSFIGGAPSGSPTTSSGDGGGNSGGGGGSGGGSTTPSFPSDAKSYGLAFLQAMGQHDTGRLSLLAVTSVTSQVADAFYNVNTQWSNRSCGQDPNDPGNSNKIACVYDNAHGDEMNVVLSRSQLGAPTAVLEVQLDKTTYPNTPDAYVGELFSAYQNGNTSRVVRLSSSTVKSKLTCQMAGSTPTDHDNSDGTFTVTLNGDGVDLGKQVIFTVLAQPGGKAGAVKNVSQTGC